MNKLIAIALFFFISNDSLFAGVHDTISPKNKNKVYLSYSPSFINANKIPFHGIEITYERNLLKWLALSYTQGFYIAKKRENAWLQTINNQIIIIPTSEQRYYFNSFATLQFIPYSNSFYELKLGVGPSLYYRYVINTKSTDKNYPYENKSFDKGVLGGFHLNFENNFFIKKHILIGVKFEPQFIFPKKNVGDKIIIFRPGINVGYRF